MRHFLSHSVIPFLLAVLAAYVLGSIMGTQFVLHSVVEMGLPVSIGLRVETTFADLVGTLAVLLPLIAIALLCAFVVAALLGRLAPAIRGGLFVLAGFVGVVALFLIMRSTLGLDGYAPVRTPLGLFALGMAGALGGWVFARSR